MEPSPGPPLALASRGFARLLTLAAIFYLGVIAYFYGDGLARHVGDTFVYTRIGMYIPLGEGRFAQVPWTRIPVLLATASSLLWCAWAFRSGHVLARLTLFFTLFGLILPQGEHVAVHLATIRGWAVLPIMAVVTLLVVVPVALLAGTGLSRRYGRAEQALDWQRLAFGRGRLVATGVVVGWMIFVAELYLGMWDASSRSLPGFVLGWAVLLAAAATIVGIVRLRTAALFGALFVAGGASVLARMAIRSAIELGLLAPSNPLAGGLGWLVMALPSLLIVALTLPFLRRVAAVLCADQSPATK